MNAFEDAVTFECAGDRLIGIVARPDRPCDVGVVVIVGGPQYRVGSHRQFVRLARRLAHDGYATLRFDCRGMGDSGGAQRSFEDVSADIDVAIAALRRACPRVERVVLWGLCDAASAALMYVDAGTRATVAGLVLVNPWVRSEATLAKTQIKHYYAKRLFARAFWGRLLRGRVGVRDALRGVARAARRAGGGSKEGTVTSGNEASASFRSRMASGLAAFGGPVLIILSGRDLTAREFEEYSSGNRTWRRLLARESVERCRIGDADHTFSSARASDDVETTTVAWLERRVMGGSR